MRENRTFQQMRDISFETNVNLHAEGSCLVKYGNTKVICTASVDEKTPHWLRNSGKGWVTAEYGMLPRSTNTRIDREAAKGKQSGRTQEIQRLIGRSLRSVIILENLGEKQIKIDYPIGVRFKSIELYDPLESTPAPILAERSQAGLITDIGILESIRDEMEEEYSIRSIHELYDSYFRDNQSISDELHHDLQSNLDKTIQDMINVLNLHLI